MEPKLGQSDRLIKGWLHTENEGNPPQKNFSHTCLVIWVPWGADRLLGRHVSSDRPNSIGLRPTVPAGPVPVAAVSSLGPCSLGGP